MTIEKNQKWRVVEYGDKAEFKFWSGKVTGKGDESLSSESPIDSWKEIIVLVPYGNPETKFSIGLSTVFGVTQMSDAERKIGDGCFGMRMGPDNCDFFIASNEGEVKLVFMKYIHISEAPKHEVVVY